MSTVPNARPGPREELAERTAFGGLYLRRLRRAQLGLSLLSVVAFGVLTGALPLVLALAPRLERISVLGVPLVVVVVAAGMSPMFLAIAIVYTRRAEALDEAFSEMVREE